MKKSPKIAPGPRLRLLYFASLAFVICALAHPFKASGQVQPDSLQWLAEHIESARRAWISPDLAALLRAAQPDATTGPSTWNGGAGNWSDGAMWTPVDPPNNAGADVSIDGGNTGVASAVTLDLNVTVGRLTIDAGDSLSFNNARSLTVTEGAFAGSGTILNNGAIFLNSTTNNTDLTFNGNTAINGTGTITLGAAATNRIFGGSLTIGVGQTIQGGGSIGLNLTTITNNGTFLANDPAGAMMIDPAAGGFTNNGILRASDGGILILTGNGGGAFTNTNLIEALDGSEVQLTNQASITGGTFSTAGTGVIRANVSQSIFLVGVTNNGTMIAENNADFGLSGTITNSGSITVNAAVSFTDIEIQTGGATLEGGGVVTLNGANAGINSASTGARLTNVDNTIQGEGRVGQNNTAFTNQAGGLIDANIAAGILTLDPVADANVADGGASFLNDGILRASNGGILRLSGNSGGTFTNNNLIEALEGSEVQLTISVRITGGILDTDGTGLIRLNTSQTASLVDLTNAGNLVTDNNSNLELFGTITNTGSISVTAGTNATDVKIGADGVTLTGGGTLTLSGINSRVNAVSGTGQRLTNVNNTIQGEGTFGQNTIAVTNQASGLIDANVSGGVLLIDPVANATDMGFSFQNLGIMQASNAGILGLTGSASGAFSNIGGLIQALDASEVQLVGGVSITGGILSTDGTGLIRLNASQTASLVDLTNAGNLVTDNASNLNLFGTINNTGSITANALGNVTDIKIGADGAILTGGGTLTLSGNNSRVNAVSGTGQRLTNVNNTIQGEGSFGLNSIVFTNQAAGLIDANVDGGTLLIDPAASALDSGLSFENLGTMQSSNGGILLFNGNSGGSITNTGGTIQALDGSEVQLTNSASITGGLLTTAGSGVVRLNGGQVASLTDLTNAGVLITDNNSDLNLFGTINNTGSISVNAGLNGTDVKIGEGGATLTGGGTLTLSGNNSFVNAVSGTGQRLTNANHTIQGQGFFGFNSIVFTNQVGGLIDGNVTGATLTIDPAATADDMGLSFQNDGILRASNGGLVVLTGNAGGAFSNGATGIFEALDGSSLTMDSSAILTNNMAGVLTLGSYRAIANGNGATLTLRGANITELAENTEVILSGVGSVLQVGTTALETSLTTNNGALRILDGRNYTSVNNFDNLGILELGGGVFDAPMLTISLNGELFGFGTVTPRPTNAGLIRAVGGTLVFSNGIEGGSGTVQIDSTGVLDLSGSAGASSADFLIHNGSSTPSLLLGAQNFVVALDYTNANFGVGNSFDPRANVGGAGAIHAAGNVAQSLTGAVSGGTTANAIMNFGNVHVGDSPTLAYQINNTGTMGPVLRGALQTSVNGGNITDGRLGGSGVTASNFGPIALGNSSGDFLVTFNASSAGALNGQTLHIINNFGNVGDQDLSIMGAAYRYANPTMHTPEPVALGNFHVGDANPMIALSLTNNVLADGFSEALNASIGSATGGVFASGSFSLLAPGATNNTSLMVGFSTAMAGNQSGTATITLQSDGTGSSGLGITNLPSQTVNVTGAVYRYAAPVINTPVPITFMNSHVGDVVTQALSVTNNVPNDGFSERLDAAFTGMTGSATAMGSFSLLGAGFTSSNDLFVGLNTSMAGNHSGTATIGFTSNGSGTSGLGSTMLPGQTINISGAVYRYASPSAHSPEPVSFGIVHVGDTVSSVALSMSNLAPADGFSESLNASISSGTSGILGSGSFNGLAPGATNNSSLMVGIDTSSAGSRNGTANISLVSNGAGSSGLGLTNLPGQTVNVTGQVNFYADPVLIFQSGSATLTMNSPTSFTLDFGNVMMDTGTYTADFGVLNFLHHAVFQDTLGGSWDLSAVDSFLLSGFDAFSGVGPGGSTDPSVTFDSGMALGSYANTVHLNSTSTNASSTTNLAQIELNLQGTVIPEPSTWAMLFAGGGLLLAFRRLSRR